MSYTARPPFPGGMSNQNQQQQQGGQQNNANIGTSGIPNMQMLNNAASIPGMANPSGSTGMSVIEQKIFQQQLLYQRQLLMQGQQQQSSQQNQQAKFQQQQQQANQNPINRIMSDMLSDKNGSNLVQQTQQFQQFAQLQALIQMQQAVQQTTKSFQQQAVPLPTNTTITPVARQNVQAMQKQPVNYPRSSNVQNKNSSQNVNSSPMQSRKSFPNAPKATVPPMQSGMVATPLNISSTSSKSTIPRMPSANSAKGYANILAASLSSAQSSMNITPSLTITKTSSPSSSTSYAKNSGSLHNKPVSTSASSQKSFLPEAISMSLGNVPISVKATQPPSVTVTPTTKSASSPTNKPFPVPPLKTNSPQNVPGLQKLSPTSPRTKQTPRKNMNPIRTTSLSPATQTSSQTVVPHVDGKSINSSTSISPSAVKQTAAAPVAPNAVNTTPVKVPIVSAVPAANSPNVPAKAIVPTATTVAPPAPQAVTKPPPSTALTNSNSASVKPNAVVAPPKIGTPSIVTVAKIELKPVKLEELKSNLVKTEKMEKAEPPQKADRKTEAVTAKPVKSEELIKSEKLSIAEIVAVSAVANKPTETKIKPAASTSETETKRSTTKEKDDTKLADKVTKPPVAKAAKALQASTPIVNAAEARVKRNRFKTVHYQSPTPEIELVSKISAAEAINAHKKKASKLDEDKLTLFYRNEFLAVRNAEGGFYLCQAMNNVYKSSPKIRIRWLSEETSNKNIYGLDFLDHTDIECVLTSVSLNKMKGKFELTKAECDRIESILKKALDVERGIVEKPDVTEENPDGLDLSLYKDESQIEKKSSGKRKLNDKGEKATPPAKKFKTDAVKTSEKKAKSSAKTSKSASKKKSQVKGTPAPAKDNGSADVQSTPINKRAPTKRKLVDETAEIEDSKNDTGVSKDAGVSKNEEPETKVSKVGSESPEETSEKTQVAADPDGSSSRSSRRSRV